MSWAKKDEYEILMGKNENEKEGKKRGIDVTYHHTNADWHSDDVTVHGEHVTTMGMDTEFSGSFHGINTISFKSKSECLRQWAGISEEISGLKCYYCNSQAFKTDQAGVAVCGAAPGWFFFYRRLAKEKKGMLKIVNGELKEVVDETPDQV